MVLPKHDEGSNLETFGRDAKWPTRARDEDRAYDAASKSMCPFAAST